MANGLGDLLSYLDAPRQAAPSLQLTPQDIVDLKKTLATEWVRRQGPEQAQGIIDTILNRRASGRWGTSIADVVNARSQFSDINGPVAWRSGRGSVDDIDPSRVDKRLSDFVDNYLQARANGAPSSVGGHLNYANRAASTPNNWGWIDQLDGPQYGAHRHGTTPELQRYMPGAYTIALPNGGASAAQADAARVQREGGPRMVLSPDYPATTGGVAPAPVQAPQGSRIVATEPVAPQRFAEPSIADYQRAIENGGFVDQLDSGGWRGNERKFGSGVGFTELRAPTGSQIDEERRRRKEPSTNALISLEGSPGDWTEWI